MCAILRGPESPADRAFGVPSAQVLGKDLTEAWAAPAGTSTPKQILREQVLDAQGARGQARKSSGVTSLNKGRR